MQHEATETRERGQMRPSSSTETRPAEPVKGEERREKAGIDLDSDHIHNSDTQQTAGRNVESTTSCLNSTANCLDLTQAVNTSAVVGSSHSGVETHGETGGKSTNVIPGVEHIFFEQELERMEDQHHGAPAGMDIVVLAVDNSKPSDMAFQFYVENVNRPAYYLHLVHHSNYWGNYEPMDGGPSPKHCMELMEKENAKVKQIEDKYRKLMQQNEIQGDFVCLRGKDAWHDIIQHQERVKAIMIVMGTRGQNSLRRTFMGSVSDSVVHHAHCPVLVCCHPKEHH